MDRLRGRAALITGGTSGIGAETVERFIREGAKVTFVGRNQKAGEAMEKRLGSDARFLPCDVSIEADVARVVQDAAAWAGRLDILFNNAGAPIAGGVDSFTADDFTYAMDLVLRSVLLGMKYAAPIMKAQRWGAIINNSSVAAHRTHLGNYLYSIAKAGVSHASRLAGMELGRFGVTVNCVSPGSIITPIFLGGSRVAQHIKPERVEVLTAKMTETLTHSTPLGRCGRPAEVAAAVAFLASDEGHYINCHDLLLDGGIIAAGRNRFDLEEGPPPAAPKERQQLQ